MSLTNTGDEWSYLDARLTSKTYEHEKQNGNDVVVEAGPVVNFEGRNEGTHQHEENRTWS